MEKKLNEYLREGERIRWQSQTEDFPLMDNGSKMRILWKWALTLIIGGGLLIAHIATQAEIRMSFVGIVLVCMAVVAVTPFFERNGLKKSRYWITDQRVIQMTKDKIFYYMDLEDVDRFEIMSDLTVKDCLAVGSAVFEEAKKYPRWRASHPMEDPEAMKNRDHVDGMLMYNIANASAAAALLKELGHRRAA